MPGCNLTLHRSNEGRTEEEAKMQCVLVHQDSRDFDRFLGKIINEYTQHYSINNFYCEFGRNPALLEHGCAPLPIKPSYKKTNASKTQRLVIMLRLKGTNMGSTQRQCKKLRKGMESKASKNTCMHTCWWKVSPQIKLGQI